MTSIVRDLSSRLICAVIMTIALSANASAQNVADGELLFKKCGVCHDIGPEAKNKIGPPLRGIFGRKAGTSDSFNYSDAVRAAGGKGLVWS